MRIKILESFGKEDTMQMKKITGWEDDNHFLHVTAELVRKNAEWLLEDICEKVGQKITYRQIEEGRRFPVAVRNEIRNIYNKRIAIEIRIAENCMEQSKEEFHKIVPYIILCFIAALTLLSLF